MNEAWIDALAASLMWWMVVGVIFVMFAVAAAAAIGIGYLIYKICVWVLRPAYYRRWRG